MSVPQLHLVPFTDVTTHAQPYQEDTMTEVCTIPESVTVNGIVYSRNTPTQPKPGKRAIVVVDRGWIFAGDVERSGGRIKLTRAIHVFRWESMGFAAMIVQGKGPKVDLRAVADVDLPEASEIFCVPVGDSWGL